MKVFWPLITASLALLGSCKLVETNTIRTEGNAHLVEPVRLLIVAAKNEDHSAFARLAHTATISTAFDLKGSDAHVPGRRELEVADLIKSGCTIREVRQTGPNLVEATGGCSPVDDPDFSWPYALTFVVIDGQVREVKHQLFEM